jgi:hypothetical protein
MAQRNVTILALCAVFSVHLFESLFVFWIPQLESTHTGAIKHPGGDSTIQIDTHGSIKPLEGESRAAKPEISSPIGHDTALSARSVPSANFHSSSDSSRAFWYDWLGRNFWTTTTGILVGMMVTVFSMLLYDRLIRRVRVRTVHRTRRKTVDEIHGLYLERIEPRERISPMYITHCLTTPHLCVKGKRDLAKYLEIENPRR